jgi:hypothetical protein
LGEDWVGCRRIPRASLSACPWGEGAVCGLDGYTTTEGGSPSDGAASSEDAGATHCRNQTEVCHSVPSYRKQTKESKQTASRLGSLLFAPVFDLGAPPYFMRRSAAGRSRQNRTETPTQVFLRILVQFVLKSIRASGWLEGRSCNMRTTCTVY